MPHLHKKQLITRFNDWQPCHGGMYLTRMDRWRRKELEQEKTKS
jgi:hypothetical protein